jgi:exonuclease SbcD
MRKLQARFPHCVHLEWIGVGAVDDGRSYQERLAGRSDLQVADEFVRHVRGEPLGPVERELLGRALLTAAREETTR